MDITRTDLFVSFNQHLNTNISHLVKTCPVVFTDHFCYWHLDRELLLTVAANNICCLKMFLSKKQSTIRNDFEIV